MTQDDFNALATAQPDMTLAEAQTSLVMFGRVLQRDDTGSYLCVQGVLWIHVWDDGTHDTDRCAVVVASTTVPGMVQVTAHGPTFAAAEKAWLEYASLEAPRLAAMVTT